MAATPSAVFGLVNAHVAACAGGMAWAGAEWLRKTVLDGREVLFGGLAGLATIAASGGDVAPQSAMVIGLVGGLVCRAVFQALREHPQSDLLSIFAMHGVGGILGMLLLGVFASSNLAGTDAAGRPVDGLMAGNIELLRLQGMAALAVAVEAALGSAAVYCLLAFVPGRRTAAAVPPGEETHEIETPT
jgi:Amt family ammonium transporter